MFPKWKPSACLPASIISKCIRHAWSSSSSSETERITLRISALTISNNQQLCTNTQELSNCGRIEFIQLAKLVFIMVISSRRDANFDWDKTSCQPGDKDNEWSRKRSLLSASFYSCLWPFDSMERMWFDLYSPGRSVLIH